MAFDDTPLARERGDPSTAGAGGTHPRRLDDRQARRRVSTALIRQLNVARVFHALRLRPGSSQRELADVTGIDRATISAVVAQLEDDGLLVRATRAPDGRVGRPEIALRIAEDAGLLVGARLEPSSVRLMAATPAGAPLTTLQVPGAMDVDDALDRLVAGTDQLVASCGMSMRDVRGIGVGVPALMDAEGRLAFAPNFGWRDVAIRARLEDRLDAPVYVDNDTKAAGLAEKLFGSCQHVQDFVFIAGHSGVGAALYLDGRLYRGRSGFAGELGHVKVSSAAHGIGRPCACGATGCLEAYVSEKAILERLRERGRAFEGLQTVAAAAEDGDVHVRGVLDASGRLLGEVCADLVTLLSPERIVLGGNFAVVAPFMLDAVNVALDAHALAAPRRRCEVVLSPLGVESVTMGGIALAMEGFLSLPGWLAAAELGQMAH